MGRALPVAPDHKLRGARLPLGERAQVLRKAVGLAGRNLAAGNLLRGQPVGRCRPLLPLGGRMCAGLSARPYFAARHEVLQLLLRLADHCRNARVRRLRAPARMRPAVGDRFFMDYFPRPPEGGQPPAALCAAPAADVDLQHPTGGGATALAPGARERHGGRHVPSAQLALLPAVHEAAVGHQPVLPIRP